MHTGSVAISDIKEAVAQLLDQDALGDPSTIGMTYGLSFLLPCGSGGKKKRQCRVGYYLEDGVFEAYLELGEFYKLIYEAEMDTAFSVQQSLLGVNFLFCFARVVLLDECVAIVARIPLPLLSITIATNAVDEVVRLHDMALSILKGEGEVVATSEAGETK